MLARKAEFGTQRQFDRIKMPANGGHFRENMPSDLSEQTGWLGREDSNLRMAESKSDMSTCEINRHSENPVESHLN
jgi:hypothetical protein